MLERRIDEVGAEYGLTSREIEIMRYIIKGRSKRYIADALTISENTVKAHVKAAYAKMGVHNKQQLLSILGVD